MFNRIKKCRVCNGKLKTLHIFKGMPRRAQNLSTLCKNESIDLIVAQCEECDLIQIGNKETTDYYKDNIRATEVSEDMKKFREEQFKLFRQNYFPSRSVDGIEIGCGKGDYLNLLDSSFIIDGLENNKSSVEYCKNKYKNLSIFQGYLNKDFNLKHKYSSFFIFNFLEHVPDLKTFFEKLQSILCNDAVGLIEVPNFDMMLKENIFYEYMLDHIFYFTKETFLYTLRLYGFDIISCDTICNNYILSATVRKRKDEDLKINLFKFLNKYEKVAVWGASHQAFFILSHFKLNKKIRYIVDSADFKWGKYSPQSNVIIHKPDFLLANPVDAVLVIAGSYSNEIKKIVREKYQIPVKTLDEINRGIF